VENVLIKALSAGPGDSEDALRDRLIQAKVDVDADALAAALQRLVDSGRLMRPRPRPTIENPNPSRGLALVTFPSGYSHSEQDPFDSVDALAADVHITVKRRWDSFVSDPQLEQWLAEDNVQG